MTESNLTKNGAPPKRARPSARRRRALALRLQGLTFAEIADQVGYASPSGAYAAVKRALDAETFDEVAEFRKLHIARLEVLIAGIWNMAREGKLGAVDRVLDLLKQEARLLGLDLPPQSHEPPEELPVKAYINFPMDDI